MMKTYFWPENGTEGGA